MGISNEILGELDLKIEEKIGSPQNTQIITLYSSLAFLVTKKWKAKLLACVIDLSCICLLLGGIVGNFFYSSKANFLVDNFK